ncbi:MAG: hypothetical protein JXR97_15600 [Planctomycetes bacterium]|nr:hypothetical protein [Planctomycetota bacterium]
MGIKHDCSNTRKCWKARALTLLVLSVSIVVLTLPWLAFGSCQTSKYHYIFQAYIYPTAPSGIIYAPSDYTGEWRIWHTSGDLLMKGFYQNGKYHGLFLFYDRSTPEPYEEVRFVNGIEVEGSRINLYKQKADD